MSSGAAPKYAAAFYVEADDQEALAAAVDYVMRRLGGGFVAYACGAQACLCQVEVKWDGSRLAVEACAERAARAVAELLIRAYTWFGGKAVQVVRL
jgi:hypothetical protein